MSAVRWINLALGIALAALLLIEAGRMMRSAPPPRGESFVKPVVVQETPARRSRRARAREALAEARRLQRERAAQAASGAPLVDEQGQPFVD
jgi:hypothetical protein